MSNRSSSRTGAKTFQVDGTWLSRAELTQIWRDTSATRTFFVGAHREVQSQENALYLPMRGIEIRTWKELLEAARKRRRRKIAAAVVLVLVAALLGGCLDGNSGITSSGSDGSVQTHVSIDGAHCPTTLGAKQ
jgi:hypothetical protein